MGNLMQLVESHNQQGTGQGADWSNLSQMVGHYNAAQSSGGGVQDFQNKCAWKAFASSPSSSWLAIRSCGQLMFSQCNLPLQMLHTLCAALGLSCLRSS